MRTGESCLHHQGCGRIPTRAVGSYSLIPLVRALGHWAALDGRFQHDVVTDIRGDEDVLQVLQQGHRRGTWRGVKDTAGEE